MTGSLFVLALLSLATVCFQLTKTIEGPLANISPLASLFLCAALFCGRSKLALLFPLGTLLVTDLLYTANAGFHPVMYVRYAAFLLLFALAWQYRRKPGWQLALGLSTIGAVVFYVATNTFSWIGPHSVYAKTLAGWWQCLTIGDPRFAPTFLFFRNALIGDWFFTLLFSAVFLMARARDKQMVRHEGTLRS